MYAKYIKRFIDFILSLLALIVLSPLFFILIPVNAIAMGGNPFFTQERPGRRPTIKNADGSVSYGEEKIFRLIKFRSMTNKKDADGNLLPDEVRLTKWGKLLRSTSLDELPELVNILKGDMAVVGPRPLLVRYLPRYNEEQHHRHDVRPGLTGLAQVNGRNAVSWPEKFAYDVEYSRKVTFAGDVKIIFRTVAVVLKHEGISAEGNATMEEFMGNEV